MTTAKPIIYTDIKDVPDGTQSVDAYDIALEELFFLEHPHLKSGMPGAQAADVKAYIEQTSILPIWIYYPWRNTVVKTVPEDVYFRLRTARNRLLLTEEQQKNFRNLKVGVAGLSVGSAIFSALVLGGGPRQIKIADFDVLEITNLNRIEGTLLDIGKEKSQVAAERAWELDPFADLQTWPAGLNKDNAADFLAKDFPIDVLVEEMDSIDMKIRMRLLCKEQGIPVIMATDNGDTVLLDIERFDQEPNREIFHGLVDHMDMEDLENIDFKKWLQLATRIVDPTYLPENMQQSLLQIGKTIPSVPQLGAIARMAGAAVSLALRRIANGETMPSGRYVINLEEVLVPEYSSAESVASRKQATESFMEQFGNR